jgi:hypothetical protein
MCTKTRIRIYLFLILARAVEVRIGASKIILRVSAPRSRLLLYRLLPALLPVNLKYKTFRLKIYHYT